MTSSVGAVAAFNEERKAVYRERKQKADIAGRGISALSDMRQIVQDAEAEVVKLRADWEAAGSPTPRPAVLTPKAEPPADALGPQNELSPAAQRVAKIAGVMVSQGETVEAVEATVGAEVEELGLLLK